MKLNIVLVTLMTTSCPQPRADGLILMWATRGGTGRWDERSRARAATALGTTMPSRMARASVARVMERAMTKKGG